MSNSESRRLESWKEIASHLRRTTRTAQRWERTEGLPVHRHVHQDQSSVYAFTDELDEWQRARTVSNPAGGSTPARDTTPEVREKVAAAHVRGKYLLGKRTAESLLAAIREFQAAIAHDPNNPLSYAALAEAFCALSGNEIWSPEDGFLKCAAAARQALALDGCVAQAHAALAMVQNMYDWDWKKSEASFERARPRQCAGSSVMS